MRSLALWNDQLEKVNPRVLRLEYEITAAKTASALVPNSASLITFDAFASQSVIDNFLGSTNEWLLADFDATAMGADAFGGLVNMNGQAEKVTCMIATCYSSIGDVATVVTDVALGSGGLTASTLQTEVECSSLGNIAFRVDFGNTPDFDALTAGLIVIELHWIAK